MSFTPGLLLVLRHVLALGMMVSLGLRVAASPARDAAGETVLAEIASTMRSLEASLALAEQSAGGGTAPIRGSAAGLTRARLEGAVKALPAVKARLQGLSQDDPAVAAWAAKVAAASARIQVLQGRLGAKSPAAGAGALPSPAAATAPFVAPADLDADIDRAGGLGQTYTNGMVLLSDPELGARLVEQLPEVKAELERMQAKYASMLGQKTSDGNRITRALDYFSRSLAGFEKFLDVQRGQLPALLEKDLVALAAMVDDAVARQRPAFFSGGIPQRVAELKPRLELMKVIDPTVGEPMAARLAQIEADLPEKQASLRDAIIASNAAPADLFRGKDRDAIIDQATQMWKRRQPGADVLAVRIPALDWKREILWRWSGTQWYKIDRSRIQLQLIVKYDSNLAIMRWITVWKDHLEGDRLSATPLWEPDQGQQPGYLLPLGKVP